MYIEKQFEEHRNAVLHKLIRKHPLATFIAAQNGDIVVNHIPFVLNANADENGLLMGHMLRSNTVWKQFDGKTRTIAVFQGAAAYITPNWYPSKKEHGKVVPTWNYVVVHAHGCPRVIQDSDWLFSHLKQLTDEQEEKQQEPWQVSDAPPEYARQLVKRIVGIEFPISTLIGKWKVSQNRPEADKTGVIEGLNGQGDDNSRAMADLVMEYAAKPHGSD